MPKFNTYITDLFSKIFTIKNLIKVLTIFIFGFSFRVFIEYTYNINVFIEYLNLISILYYTLMSSLAIIVHEMVIYFEFNFIYSFFEYIYVFILKILKNMLFLKGFGFNSLKNQMFMSSNVNEIKPYREIGLSYKGNSDYRPVKSSPLSNPPITPDNCPSTFTNPSNTQTNRSTIPINHQSKASDLVLQDKWVTKCKDQFKEFYTTYRDSIKLSDYELEKLSLKIAKESKKESIDVEKAMDILPNDIKPLFRKFIIRKITNKS